MPARSLRRWVLTILALGVAAAILPPFINIGRYKARIAASIGEAVGRPVTVDNVELRLLPGPGFYLENVTIGDDPSFSGEPILHADEVTAYLRLSSLWRGRLEIARLKLNFPSFNLVERGDESWNLESLLWKASRTQAAPTAAEAGPRKRFPYIEATNGRINFKHGLEKSVFSFTDADFVLFSPAENHWRMRLTARPVRTDMPVTDTGTIKAEFTIQRAALLRDAPMKGSVTWERLQLGNLTRLVYGQDRGWRGAVDASAQIEGTPAALHVTSATRLLEVRRYDISGGDNSPLNLTCAAVLNVSDRAFTDAECRMPLQSGVVRMKGTLRGIRQPRYDLTFSAESVSANALVNLSRRAKRDLPADLAAEGTLAASFHGSRLTDAPSEWVGNLELNGLLLRSSVLEKELALPRITAVADTTHAPEVKRGRHPQPAAEPLRALQIQPLDLPLGAATPAKLDGQADEQGFVFHLKGDSHLEQLQQVARALGIAAPRLALSGQAALDLTLAAPWIEFATPSVSGTALLKAARAEVPGLAEAIEVSTARVEFDQQHFTLRGATAAIGKVNLTGSATFPRACSTEAPCEATLQLATDELNPERWNELLNSSLKKQKWYNRLGVGGGPYNVMANLRASGHFTARRLLLDTTPGSVLETDFTVANGVLKLKNARAELFGGSVSGEWTLDFTGPAPLLTAEGTAARVQAEKLATLLKSAPGTGALDLKYKLTLTGADAAALLQSAQAEADFTWNGGTLKFAPDAKAPLKVASGQGRLKLDADGWVISESQWKTPAGPYKLTGAISRDSALNLVFTEAGGAMWKLGGTLQKPALGNPAAPASMRGR